MAAWMLVENIVGNGSPVLVFFDASGKDAFIDAKIRVTDTISFDHLQAERIGRSQTGYFGKENEDIAIFQDLAKDQFLEGGKVKGPGDIEIGRFRPQPSFPLNAGFPTVGIML